MDDITKVLLRRLQTMRSEIQFMESVISGEADFQTSERLLEKKQAAAFLGVSYRTINRWLDEGLLVG